MKKLNELLKEFNACQEAIDWVGDKTIEKAISDSQRGDWLLWLSKKLDLPFNKLILAKARCAKTVIHLMKDKKCINAVNVAEKFGLDECNINELNYAAYAADTVYAYTAADAAAYTAADTVYADASDAAAYAADAAADNVYAAYAAYADNAVAYAADAAAARTKNREQTSYICVEILGQLIIDSVNSKLI